MSQTFQCKECDAQIEYRPQESPGGIGFQTRRLPTEEFTVYLTCENGHVHAYRVKPAQEGDIRGG